MPNTRVGTRWLLVPVLLTAAACLVGCAGVKIVSNVDSSRTMTLNRVFVVSHLASISEKFGAWSEGSLRDAFWDAGIQSEVTTVDPLSLDSGLDVQDFPSFVPDAVLVLTPRTLIGVHMDRASQAVVDASLYDPTDEARLWRATITVVSGGNDLPLQQNAAEAMAKRIVGRMLEDGFAAPPA